MGGSSKRAVTRQGEAQERISETQERLGQEFLDQSKTERARQEELFKQIQPFAQQLMGIYQPGNFEGVERPDISAQIRRDYSDELTDIETSKNRAIAEAEGFATSSGLARSGIRGVGLARVARGALEDRGGARRTMQQRLTDESLGQYYDKRAERGEDISASVAGGNILAGQQGVFNPQGLYGLGAGQYGGAAQTRRGAAQTHQAASRIPGIWSKVGGIAGAGLSLANPATAAGGGLARLGKRF